MQGSGCSASVSHTSSLALYSFIFSLNSILNSKKSQFKNQMIRQIKKKGGDHYKVNESKKKKKKIL